MATKLHEIIAVDQGLKATAKKINQETITTFEKRDEHFAGIAREIRYFADEDARLNADEGKELVTTVAERLLYGTEANIRALDVFLRKEATNQIAKADIVVGDVVLAKDVPATALLGLETKLTEIRQVYEKIPTLAPGRKWVPAPDIRAKGAYRGEAPDVTFRGKKVSRPIVLAPATTEHPAQVQLVTDDINVAKITATHVSGMMTSADKSLLLERIDRLLRAVKRARQRANSAEADMRKIGADIFAFIHEGIVT